MSATEEFIPSKDAKKEVKKDILQDEKPKGNKSWEKPEWNDNTWSPVNKLHIELKDDRLSVRWVRDDKAHSKVANRLSEGWVFVKRKDIKKFNHLPITDGDNMDSLIRVREMVAMMIPKTKVEARTAFLKTQVLSTEKTIQKQREMFKDETGIKKGNMLDMDEVSNMPIYRDDPSLAGQQINI